MMPLGLLVLVGVIMVAVVANSRGAARRDRMPRSASGSSASKVRLEAPGRSATPSEFLTRWVAEGLVSADQAQAILEHEQAQAVISRSDRVAKEPTRERRSPIFVEALGYLGGVLAIAGLTLLVANYWPELSTSIRLGLSLGTALLLGGVGGLVHEQHDPTLARLRWFLWTLSSAAAALFTGVLMIDVLDVDTPLLAVGACSGTVAAINGLLWRWRDRPIQELLFVGAAIVSAAAFVGGVTNPGVAGLTAWALGALVLVCGLRGITPRPLIPHVVGTLAVVVGAFVTLSEWMGAGLLFVTATSGGLLLLAALPQLTMDAVKRVVLIVVATVGALQGVPPTLAYFAAHAGGVTGLVTWALGGAALLAGTRRLLRAPIVAETIGGLGLLGGAALTGMQWANFAPVLGLATALTLLAIGMLPGRVLYSLLGSLGLLINVPWAVSTFFPGEGRAPLLITVSGLLIVVVAGLLARQSDRFRSELTSRRPDEPTDQPAHEWSDVDDPVR
jgi:hypothetical protein